MKLNITRELDTTIRIRRIRVDFHARDINSNGCNGYRSIEDRAWRGLDSLNKLSRVASHVVSNKRLFAPCNASLVFLTPINISIKSIFHANSREEIYLLRISFLEELLYFYIDRVNSSFSKSNKNYGEQERTRILSRIVEFTPGSRQKFQRHYIVLSFSFFHRTILVYIFLFQFIFTSYFFFILFKIHCSQFDGNRWINDIIIL